MAAPVISGTTPAGPLVFVPGETKTLRVNATDADIGPAQNLKFHAVDEQGNIADVTVQVQVADHISYSFDPPPAGWIVTQDATDRALFTIKAP